MTTATGRRSDSRRAHTASLQGCQAEGQMSLQSPPWGHTVEPCPIGGQRSHKAAAAGPSLTGETHQGSKHALGTRSKANSPWLLQKQDREAQEPEGQIPFLRISWNLLCSDTRPEHSHSRNSGPAFCLKIAVCSIQPLMCGHLQVRHQFKGICENWPQNNQSTSKHNELHLYGSFWRK